MTAPPPGYRLGIDGKIYRDRPLSPEERSWLTGIVHDLSHDAGASVREIRAAIIDQTGERPSVGWISQALRQSCPRCSGVAIPSENVTPEHRDYVIAQCKRYGWDASKILSQIGKAANPAPRTDIWARPGTWGRR